MLCVSVRHSSFENMIYGFLSSNVKPPGVITEVTEQTLASKANWMSKMNPSKRNVNYQKFNKDNKYKKGNKKKGNKK